MLRARGKGWNTPDKKVPHHDVKTNLGGIFFLETSNCVTWANHRFFSQVNKSTYIKEKRRMSGFFFFLEKKFLVLEENAKRD